MSDPSEALQRALFAALSAAPAVLALVAGRVFDAVPEAATYPYISLGDVQTLDDGAGCIDGTEAFLDVHAWSQAVGAIEAKRIVSAVRGALHEADLDLGPGHRLVEITFRDQRSFRDPDGKTTHAVITFRALTETV